MVATPTAVGPWRVTQCWRHVSHFIAETTKETHTHGWDLIVITASSRTFFTETFSLCMRGMAKSAMTVQFGPLPCGAHGVSIFNPGSCCNPMTHLRRQIRSLRLYENSFALVNMSCCMIKKIPASSVCPYHAWYYGFDLQHCIKLGTAVMPIFSARRAWQQDRKFRVILSYIMSLRTVWIRRSPGTHREIEKKKKGSAKCILPKYIYSYTWQAFYVYCGRS